MSLKGFLKLCIFGTASTALMGVVLSSNINQPLYKPVFNSLRSESLQADTPQVQLPFNFKDNNGRQPQFDDKNKLYLNTPSNVKTDVEYDPKTGNYNVTQKMGDLRYRPDTYIESEDYQNYMFKKSVGEYWRTRIKADDINNKPKKGIVPKLQVNSELFDRIFGGNTVDIRPTGTAELIFGLNRNKTLNPAIPQRQQKVTNFDFNMRIQLNLIGKIGDKLKITTSYNTEASFDWENQVKLDYTGYEDEIIKKIEAGNVTMPLNSSLITGSQSLFGIKTQLQFGRLTATTVFSQQRGKKQEVNIQGGAQTQQFSVAGDNYESNKHFFLAHYFRDNYDSWMSTLPIVNTPIVITRVEVYVLNQTGNQEQVRSVIAFEDLGEDSVNVHPNLRKYGNVSNPCLSLTSQNFAILDSAGNNPSNGANNLYDLISNPNYGILAARDGAAASGTLTGSGFASNSCNTSGGYMQQGRDFDRISTARKLNANEYTLNNRLGFISLNQAINNDQALAVTFQYSYNGKTYQVGEFSDQFPDNTKTLFTKLLKGSITNVRYPMWDLMMKNVYSIGAYNLNQQDFKLDVVYNNIETGVDINYIPYGAINGQQLIRVLNCDKLNVNGDKQPDGIFDFLPGYTINPANGRIYFTTIEPFGTTLRSKFDPNADFPTADAKYVFQELYDSTKISAQQRPEKNRFKIKGSFKSASGSEISLNALNIPQGAVQVTANGVRLNENTDYTVDYTLGRVKIINESILNSGAQIKVSVESNSLFNIQQKSLMGTRLDFKVNRDLTIGGTLLRYAEKPVTQKVNTGDEPVSNIIWGTDYNYKTDVPFITRMLDRLPLFSTKEMSSITTQGEFAQLIPGNAAAIGKSGTSYVDDFEGSISLIDIRNPQAWSLASIPQGIPGSFPEANFTDSILTGKNRARFNWYTIDPSLTRKQSGYTPSSYGANILSNNFFRQVFETELFPGKTPPNGQQVVMPVLDMGFYPSERGPYNYDVDQTPFTAGVDKTKGTLKDPQSRWGGMMRRLETNDFQAANIEYIQFWMMDPFNEDYNTDTHPEMDPNKKTSGDMYINLGNVSEDILKDGHMSYENGIPGKPGGIAGNLPIVTTNLAVVPTLPPIANAFSSDETDRPYQDVGYDGMDNDAERAKFKYITDQMTPGPADSLALRFINDPSSDSYHHFRGDDYDGSNAYTLDRYAKYNNPEGNSPTEAQYKSLNSGGYPTSATNVPNIEDINKDNTLSETESFYQYHIKISKQDIDPSNVGKNFIVNSFDGSATVEGVSKTVKWYQFKVPITEFENVVGGIEGFNSIRFMRVYMKGFDKPVVVRLARFELVRSDWRRYAFDLTKPGEYLANDDNTTSFDVSAVSVQENGQKTPVNYVIPPGIAQQQNIQTTNLVLQNEQALQLRVSNLKDGDSRAIYKPQNDLDARMFKHLKMFLHAEKVPPHNLNNGDLTVFVRVGSDYNANYYEYEVPLTVTAPGYYDPLSDDGKYSVWPSANEINIPFDALTNAKEERNQSTGKDLGATLIPYSTMDGNNKITVVGNPNLGSIKTIMIGVRNPKDNGAQPHYVEVWVNELRLTDFNNKGGWATTGRVQAKLADLGNVSVAGTYSKPFFGSVEKKINERSKETTFNWDVTSTFQIGKFFPNKWKVNLPVYYSYGETKVTPLFNPYEPDVQLAGLTANDKFSADDIRNIKRNSQDYTQRKGLNFTNVKIDGLKRKGAKPMPWDISNFSATYAYTEMFRRNVNIDHNNTKQYRGNLTYGFQLQPKPWKPFDKMKIFENKWFAIIKEFSLQPLPNRFGVSMDVTRNYSELLNRDITSFYTGSIDKTLTQYNKQFLFARVYDFRWDFSKALKFDYSANMDGRYLEAYGALDTREKKDSVKHEFKGLGTNVGFRQQYNINYNIPINKIPIFDFVSATYRYGGTYTWNRRPFAAVDTIGNTIQNTNSQNYNLSFNMISLYNKIPYFKKINSGIPTGGGKKGKQGKSDSKGQADSLATEKDDKGSENFSAIAEFLARGVMMIKNVSVTLQKTNGQGLPNFKPSARYLGMDDAKADAPGIGFVSGSQTDIRQEAADKGWLAHNLVQTTPYTRTSTKNFTYRTTLEPHGSLKIELNGLRNQSTNLSEYMRWDTLDHTFHFDESKSETGNFSISAFTLGKSFKDKPNGVESGLFTEFLQTRQNYAEKLSTGNSEAEYGLGHSKGLQTNSVGKPFYDGYGLTQQDVLMGSFYETYTGRKIKNYNTKNIFPGMPMPNWTISWDGLGKLKPMKKLFRSITVRHGYRSTYTIGGYSNNLLYADDKSNGQTIGRSPVANPDPKETSNFNPYYSATSVVLSEAFAPLIKFDLQFNKPGWQGNFEVKKDKTVTLNLTGPQIIETKGQEYVVGIGYRYPKLTIKRLMIQGKPLQSDLNIKIDLSYRRNVSVIRGIVNEISTPTGGTNIVTLRSAIDYQLTQNINLRLFYDWIHTKPQTSASFPTANVNAGFSLRINLQ